MYRRENPFNQSEPTFRRASHGKSETLLMREPPSPDRAVALKGTVKRKRAASSKRTVETEPRLVREPDNLIEPLLVREPRQLSEPTEYEGIGTNERVACCESTALFRASQSTKRAPCPKSEPNHTERAA